MSLGGWVGGWVLFLNDFKHRAPGCVGVRLSIYPQTWNVGGLEPALQFEIWGLGMFGTCPRVVGQMHTGRNPETTRKCARCPMRSVRNNARFLGRNN